MINIRIDGLDRLLGQLNGAPENILNEVNKAVDLEMRKIRDGAIRLAPVDLGDLKGSISSETQISGSEIVGAVMVGAEHGIYQEFGTGQRGESSPSPPKYDGNLAYTRTKTGKDGEPYDYLGIPAQPFLYPAFKQNEQQLKQAVRQAVVKALADRE